MPGVTANVIDAPAGEGVISDTGKLLAVAEAQKGSTSRYEIVHSMAEFLTKLGTRQSTSYLYDAAETFFAEGGSTLIVARVVGPAAIAATLTLVDGSAGPALTVKANSPGAWANGAAGGLKVQVVAGGTGGTFVLKVLLNDVVVETSPDLADAAAAINWAAVNSSYVVISDPGATADPAVVAATSLATGTDDRASIVTASWQAALDRLIVDLGPGQIIAPGITTAAVAQAVINHAADHNRVALLDGPNSIVATDFSALLPALTGEGRKHAALFGPWAIIPGLTQDTTRTVPYSAVQAGIIARNDGAGDPPNVDTAAAGDEGYSRRAIGLTVNWDKATINSINALGVTAAKVAANGRVQTYGDRTLANINTQRAWLELSSARLFMYVVAGGREISEHFVFKPLDAAGRTVGQYAARLKAFLEKLAGAGMIYNDPQTAVDAGPQVNTSVTLAARELHANLTVQPAEAAEDVVLNVAAKAA